MSLPAGCRGRCWRGNRHRLTGTLFGVENVEIVEGAKDSHAVDNPAKGGVRNLLAQAKQVKVEAAVGACVDG